MNQPLNNDPHDIETRTTAMQTDVLLIAIAGLSLMQGMAWSPTFLPARLLLTPFLGGTFLGTPLVIAYLASMLVSALTLVLAGVPAALYERWKGGGRTSPVSLMIWLAFTILLVVLPYLVVGPISG